MFRFSSRRERRLWAWTAVSIVAIYSTIGLTSTFARVVPEDGQRAIVFVIAMCLVGITVLTQGLSVRPRGLEIGVVIGIVAVCTMFSLRLTMAERSHLIEYGVVAVFLFEALSERARLDPRMRRPALVAMVATAAVGTVDELIQALLPSRVFDPVDILFNASAGVAVVTACVALRLIRKRTSARRDR